MAKSSRHEKLTGIYHELVAKFLQENSNYTSLITVTNFVLTDSEKNGIAMITVFPDSAEEKALAFVMRKRTELREYVKAHSRYRTIPFFEFRIDAGEKNRQRIDELLRGDSEN